MDENFNCALNRLFDDLERFFDELAARTPDLDADWQSDTVFRLSMDEGGEILISAHSSTQEVWLSAQNGGFHFQYKNGQWLDTRDSKTLGEKISQALSALGLNVKVPF